MSSIQFLGAAGTVTGSKFLIERGGARILVDCGLFQGIKPLRRLNWNAFPVDPKSLDAVVLTHAHLDHSGALPLLRRGGFRGPIHCTAPTAALSKIILLDSAKIQEEDAAQAEIGGYSKHHPPKPLYTTEEAEKAFGLLRNEHLNEWIPLAADLEVRFLNAGHILGSAMVQLRCPDFTITFTGDLGRRDPLVLLPPERVTESDYLVIESTYGDRLHSPLSPLRELAGIINETFDRGGHLIIPAFSVGRTQDLLYLIMTLKQQSQIRDVPVYLDSPMGIEATSVLTRFPAWHRLSPDEITQMGRMTHAVRTHRESMGLLSSEESTLVIAGSGMITGGRVLAHLAKRLPDPRTTVVLAGYQAAGTRGSLIATGSPQVKIHGKYVENRAQIRNLSMLSAHADQKELLDWAREIKTPPRKTFIVHGEPQSSDTLRLLFRDQLGHDPVVPSYGETHPLSGK